VSGKESNHACLKSHLLVPSTQQDNKGKKEVQSIKKGAKEPEAQT